MLGCHKSNALAELVGKDGPVEKAEGSASWANADIGAKWSLGDSARTAEGGAKLDVSGGAVIDMLPHTVLRFGSSDGTDRISVETGAIELSGATSYGLDVGDVQLSAGGKVRITALGVGKSSIALAVGTGSVTTRDGKTVNLEVKKDLELVTGSAVVTPVDAGVADAAVAIDAAVPVDAGPPPEPVGDIAVETTGKTVETSTDGKSWKAVPTGMVTISKGQKLRVGNGSTAKITAGGATLQLSGGARVSIGEDALATVDAGAVDIGTDSAGNVHVPGGDVAVSGQPGGAHVEVNGREAKVTVTRGAVKLTGGPGTALEMNRGESATLAHGGERIQPLEAIPREADFRVAVGETLTIHDPRPPTAVEFQFQGKCTGGGVIEADRDSRFRTAKQSAGKESAKLALQSGGWYYRLRCTTGASEGAAVASGRIVVTADDGRRPLPPKQPPTPVDADGRTWRMSYQSVIPNLEVHYKGSEGTTYRLHLAQGGKDQAFDGKSVITIPGGQLREGTYTYWFDRDGVKQDKVSTLKIEFDQTAPQVYIELPANGKAFDASGVLVSGAVLPGWTAAVDGVELPLDKSRRFNATVQTPQTTALAIRLSHPQRGIHYYLRRPR